MFTSDNVNIKLDSIVHFKIMNPIISAIRIEDINYNLFFLCKLKIRSFLSAKKLQDLSTNENVSRHIRTSRVKYGNSGWIKNFRKNISPIFQVKNLYLSS